MWTARCFLLLAAAVGAPYAPSAWAAAPVRVFAAASLLEPIREIARDFESTHGTIVQCNFAASSILARQIEAGAPCDIYLSADGSWIVYLDDQHLLSRDARCLPAGNRLVLAAADAWPDVRLDPQLSAPPVAVRDGRMAIADPAHVPAGRYARQALDALGWWPLPTGQLVTANDAKATVRLLEMGEVAVAMVYASDVRHGAGLRTLAMLPAETHAPIAYHAALTAGAQNSAEALLVALCSPAAEQVFARHGFTPAPAPVDGLVSSASAVSSGVWSALGLSLRVALLSTLIALIPGIGLGWLFARKQFIGKPLIDVLVHLPLVLPPVAVGYLLLLSVGRRSWLGAIVEQHLGLSFAFSFEGAVLAAGIMGFPLMVRAIRQAIESVDPRLEEAARTLGASPWQTFVSVTLPLARPGVYTGTVLAFARSLGEFGATMTLAGNVARESRTLPLAMYTAINTPGGERIALQLMWISLALAAVALVVSEYLTRRGPSHA